MDKMECHKGLDHCSSEDCLKFILCDHSKQNMFQNIWCFKNRDTWCNICLFSSNIILLSFVGKSTLHSFLKGWRNDYTGLCWQNLKALTREGYTVFQFVRPICKNKWISKLLSGGI